MEPKHPLLTELEGLIGNLEHDLKSVTKETFSSLSKTYMGKEGTITLLHKSITSLNAEEKRTIGPRLNELRTKAHQMIDDAKTSLESKKDIQTSKPFDVTAYLPTQKGSLHPYTHLTNLIEDIATSMGFSIAEGPEIDTEFNNFEGLNIPADHPARDAQDTFWLNVPRMLLRTQTSTVQCRAMQTQTPPLAIISMGRVFRNEATDATHDFMFSQCEMLLVDKKVSMANLIAIAQEFFKHLFGAQDLKQRIRPGFFPFVEPGIEVDFQCPFCKTGCSTCKRTTWIEAGGAGLVHPNVLRANGINPDEYQACAFGFGLTRWVMLKYGINDVRLLHQPSLAFLKQF